MLIKKEIHIDANGKTFLPYQHKNRHVRIFFKLFTVQVAPIIYRYAYG